jgi:hypothetical protein
LGWGRFVVWRGSAEEAIRNGEEEKDFAKISTVEENRISQHVMRTELFT